MKTTTRSAAILLSVLCIAASSTFPVSEISAAEEFPHAYPREGVKTLFENDRVFAWDVTWLRGIEQPYHRHRYDMAAVYLRYGPILVTQLDGSVNSIRPPFEIPRPFFQGRGVTHKEEMLGFPPDTPQRWAIMFDLKDVSKPPLEPPTGVAPAFPREGAELAIDNERVSEWVHAWGAASPLPTHMYTLDSVQVFTAPGRLRFTDASGAVQIQTVAVGDARFIPAGTLVTEEAISGTPRAVTIELK